MKVDLFFRKNLRELPRDELLDFYRCDPYFQHMIDTPYLVDTRKIEKGLCYVLVGRLDGEIIATCQLHIIPEISPVVGFYDKRLLVRKDFRGKSLVFKHFLPIQEIICVQNNLQFMIKSFNLDRKYIYDRYKSVKNGGIFYPGFAYNDELRKKVIIYDGLYRIYGVEQLCVGNNFSGNDEKFEFPEKFVVRGEGS